MWTKYTNSEVQIHKFLSFEDFSLKTAMVHESRMLLDFQEFPLKLHPSHQYDSLLPRIPHIFIFHQWILQETKSKGKIWSPYKFGSMGINWIIRNLRIFRILRNSLQNTSGIRKLPNSHNLIEWPNLDSVCIVVASFLRRTQQCNSYITFAYEN